MSGNPGSELVPRPSRRGRLIVLGTLLVVAVGGVSTALVRKKRHDDRQRLLRTPLTLRLPPRPLPVGEPLLQLPPVADGQSAREVLDGPGVRALLRAHETARLEALAERLWREQETQGAHDELVDDLTLAFQVPDPRLARPLDQWVEERPDSALAHLARAAFWMGVGTELRGGAFVHLTAEGKLEELDEALDRARPDARRAAELAPRATAPHELLLELAKFDGDRAAVRREGRAAIDGCPSCMTVRVHLMRALAPRWGGSVEEMQALVDDSPVKLNPRFAALQGFIDADEGDLDENPATALPRLERALAKGEHWSFLAEKARRLSEFRKHDAALAALDRAQALRPNIPEVIGLRAVELTYLERWDEAAEALVRLLELDPAGQPGSRYRNVVVTSLHSAAWDLKERGQTARAIELEDLAIGLNPREHNPKAVRFQMVFQGLDPVPATLKRLRADLAETPDDFRCRQRLDWLLSLLEKYDEILPLWNDYLSRHPDDARALTERAGTRSHLGDTTGATADAMKACSLGLLEACDLASRLGAEW